MRHLFPSSYGCKPTVTTPVRFHSSQPHRRLILGLMTDDILTVPSCCCRLDGSRLSSCTMTTWYRLLGFVTALCTSCSSSWPAARLCHLSFLWRCTHSTRMRSLYLSARRRYQSTAQHRSFVRISAAVCLATVILPQSHIASCCSITSAEVA